MMRRRDIVGVAGFLALGGCGFAPVYARHDAAGETSGDQLAAISVGIIPERPGQLLRQALQDRLLGADPAPIPKYDLRTAFQISSDAIGILQDSTVTRVRFVGYAEYTLVSRDPTPVTITSGTARALDGFNSISDQFFAGDLDTEVVIRRLASSVADQIALQLGAYFARPAKVAASGAP